VLTTPINSVPVRLTRKGMRYPPNPRVPVPVFAKNPYPCAGVRVLTGTGTGSRKLPEGYPCQSLGGGRKQEARAQVQRENSRLKNELDLAQRKAQDAVIQRDELRREIEKNKRVWEELKKSLSERMVSLQEDKAIAEREAIGTYISKPSWQLYTDKDNGRCTERSSNGQPDSKWCVNFIVLKTSCVY
jgi:hypothetical protein